VKYASEASKDMSSKAREKRPEEVGREIWEFCSTVLISMSMQCTQTFSELFLYSARSKHKADKN